MQHDLPVIVSSSLVTFVAKILAAMLELNGEYPSGTLEGPRRQPSQSTPDSTNQLVIFPLPR